jgi:HEAT repeat protein
MANIINFDDLMADHDIPGLVAALRQPEDADLREAAARALGDLGDVAAVEALIRSVLQDPDSGVRKAARAALDLLVGMDAGLAIASFGAPPGDPWLVETAEFEFVEPEDAEEPYQADLDAFIDEDDLEGLVACLRHPRLPGLRTAAAEALGELGETEAVEPLIRSHLEDPEPEVRQAAYSALDLICGANTSLAISAYRSGPPPRDEWLEEPDPAVVEINEEEEPGPGSLSTGDDMQPGDPLSGRESAPPPGGPFSKTDINGLMAVLAGEPDLKLRLKAIQALQQVQDSRAVDILAYAALRSDVPALRKAAEILKNYRESEDQDGSPEDEEDDSGEEDSRPVEPARSQPGSAYSGVLPSQPGSVIQEEHFPWWLLAVGAGIVLLIIAVLLLIK